MIKFVKQVTLEQMNAHRGQDMTTHLGIEFTEVGENFLAARMPVDARTRQPMGLLHGGASVVLAETLGSMAGFLMLPEGKTCVGLEINANHIRSVREGYVFGKATPLHIGKNTHVWDIKIHDEHHRLVCVSRLTLAVIHTE
jgi:1,4-dihydroxy-2-naphthoyl-CoA hydrolase